MEWVDIGIGHMLLASVAVDDARHQIEARHGSTWVNVEIIEPTKAAAFMLPISCSF